MRQPHAGGGSAKDIVAVCFLCLFVGRDSRSDYCAGKNANSGLSPNAVRPTDKPINSYAHLGAIGNAHK